MKAAEELKVLLIEDNPHDAFFVRRVAELASREAPLYVEQAGRLKEGLALLERKRFDAVLLDLMLPDSLTIDTFLTVHAKHPNIPIVILTGLEDEQMAMHAVAQGAQDYLVKGKIGPELLNRSLRYAVQRKRALACLQSVISGSIDGLVVVDAEGLVRFVNPAVEGVVKRKAQELLDQSFERLFGPGRYKPGEVRLLRMAERFVEVRAAEIEWEGEKGVLVSLRDITDTMRLEQLREKSLAEGLAGVRRHGEDFLSEAVLPPARLLRSALEAFRRRFLPYLREPARRAVEKAEEDVGALCETLRRLPAGGWLADGLGEEPRPALPDEEAGEPKAHAAAENGSGSWRRS